MVTNDEFFLYFIETEIGLYANSANFIFKRLINLRDFIIVFFLPVLLFHCLRFTLWNFCDWECGAFVHRGKFVRTCGIGLRITKRSMERI